jgi:hypothetical protein
MLSQVIKVIDPQRDFSPIKYSERQEKIAISDSVLGVVLKFYAEESKKKKQKEIRKCAQNWCLK